IAKGAFSSSQRFLTIEISSSVSEPKRLRATTGGFPSSRTLSTCFSRFSSPAATAAASGLVRSFLARPPCILSARTVATRMTAAGSKPAVRHLMSKNFSAPRSQPKPASVDEGRHSFEGLHQVRLQGVGEEREHRPRGLQLGRLDRRLVVGEADENPIEPLSQILLVLGEAEDRHDLGGGGDVESRFARHSLERSPEPDDRAPERAVVHVEDAPPESAARIDPEGVSEIQMVVEDGGKKVVGGGNGVEVPGEVQVDSVHRVNLAVAAAGRAPFDSHARPK